MGNSKYGPINAFAKRQKQVPDADSNKYTAQQWKAYDASRPNQIGQSTQGRWGSAINHGIFASADGTTIAFGNTVVKYSNPLPEVFNAANCPAKFAPSNDPEKRNKWCKHPEACCDIRAKNFNAPNDVQLSNLNAFTAESSIAPSRALLAENITDEITDEENLTAVRTSLLGETVRISAFCWVG